MLTRARIRHHLDDVAELRVRAHAAARRVEVDTARERAAALIRIGGAGLQLAEPLVDAGARASRARQDHALAEDVPAHGSGNERGIREHRERRIENVDFLLAEAVDAQGLLVGVVREPVVEDAPAHAQRGR